ncbi:MAG: O-antigen ligase family protein [Planctomycetaceae bacterium]|nr:O-antigen ligase family protein [Planctomycetaceae bacterium]
MTDSVDQTAIEIPIPSAEIIPRQKILSWMANQLAFLESVYDLGLVISIVCVPLAMAGIREIGVAIFVICSLIMGLVWAVREIVQPTSTTRFSGAELLVLLAIGLVGLQLIPLSPNALAWLSPYSMEALSLWGTAEGRLLGTHPWQTISLTPGLTRSGLVLLFAYAVFFLSLTHRLLSSSDIDRVIRLVAASATIMALIGLGQLFFGNGKYLWLFDHPNRPATGAAKGTFVNQNHFAGFLALGIGPLIWCWQTRLKSATKRAETFVWQTRSSSGSVPARLQDWPGIALAAVTLAALFSLSRGGIVVLGIAGAFALIASAQNVLKAGRMALPAIAFAVAGVLAFGADSLTDEIHSVTSVTSLEELWKGRAQLWMAIVNAIPSFWPAGSGLGSHPEVYPTWLSTQTSMRYSHAENGYLQILLELGVPGLILLLSGIAMCIRWSWTGWKRGDAQGRLRVIAVAAGLLASVLHSLVDFVWYIPGYLIVALTLAACACRCFQLSTHHKSCDESEPVPVRHSIGPVLAWFLLLCIFPIGRTTADVLTRNVSAANHWNDYRGHAIQGSKHLRETSTKSVDQRLDLMIDELEACIAADPHNHQALTNLAALSLRRFELNIQDADNQMTLRQIQDTVKNANFESPAETHDWLTRAFGDDIHDLERAFTAAQQGLQGQPLRGEAYIVLAEVGFLVGIQQKEKEALVSTAVQLRPHNPAVLYSAGALTAESGYLDGAFEFWRQAYAQSPTIQQQLVTRLAPHLSAIEFATRLNPGPDGLWMLFEEYGDLGRTDEQMAAAQLFARHFNRLKKMADPTDASFWTHAHQMFQTLNARDQALHCLKQAVLLDPQSHTNRRALIFELIENEDYQTALRHLDWYRLRYPDDQEIAEALKMTRSQVATQQATNVGGRIFR